MSCNLREIDACNVWLQMEISRVKPHVLVALGATALRALLGRTLTMDRRVGLALRSVAVKPARRPRAVYCFFDNTDEKLRAPADAKALMKTLGLEWQATAPSV
jgi:uracil-DNA glycosylase